MLMPVPYCPDPSIFAVPISISVFLRALLVPSTLAGERFVPQSDHEFPAFLQYENADVRLSFRGARLPGPEACAHVPRTRRSAVRIPEACRVLAYNKDAF